MALPPALCCGLVAYRAPLRVSHAGDGELGLVANDICKEEKGKPLCSPPFMARLCKGTLSSVAVMCWLQSCRTTEHPELDGTHRGHRAQLLASHGTTQKSDHVYKGIIEIIDLFAEA